MPSSSTAGGFGWAVAIVIACTCANPVQARGSLSFSKVFESGTIGPGSVSTLRFDISSAAQVPATDLAFTDVLPAGVTIAAPANVSNSCGGILTAPDGGGTITFSDGTLGALAACSLTVDVTSGLPGVHMNESGDLTSSLGNHGAAAADLTVDSGRPGFTKSFSPASVPLGARGRLTFTVDNTANNNQAVHLTFTDNLPGGLVVAEPADPAVACSGGVLTAAPGTGVISYGPAVGGDAAVAAGGSCSISVDVVADGGGMLGNTSGELTSTSTGPVVSSGKAAAVLEVAVGELHLAKQFADDPVPPGGPVTLEFTVANRNRTEALTDIEFIDDLDAALSGLAAVGTPLSDPCGPGSALSGTGLLSLTGGNLAPEASCTFSVTLQVPAGATPGSYPNTTSQVSGEALGEPVVGNAASDLLFVEEAPILTKEFTDDPVTAGDTVTLEFSILNTSSVSSATDIGFTDNLTDTLAGLSAIGLPMNDVCGAGSSINQVPGALGTNVLVFSGGSLAPGGSCTFSVTLQIPPDVPGGSFLNRTSEVTASVDGATVTGNPAADNLTVVTAPALRKEFTDDPVVAGDTVTLEFTLAHGAEAQEDATNIAFTDDLDAALSGLSAVGPPLNDICGAGSAISGTTVLTFTGGMLSPGESCTFSVTLQVPAAAPPGSHTNITSEVSATVGGLAVNSPAARNDLVVASLLLSKEFIDDPVIAGGTVTLQFTIDNVGGDDATEIAFIDNLGAVLSGLTADGLPLTDVCGAGSMLEGTSGNSVLVFSAGSLPAGDSCTFSVTLDVPAGATDGTYPNTTSNFSATIGGEQIGPDNAFDVLTVNSTPLLLIKEFTDDPAAPGGVVTLLFTLTNLGGDTLTDIAFSDDLDAVLPGLEAISLPPAGNACNGTGTLSGTTLLSFTGGELAPGASCGFAATLSIPEAGLPGTAVTNTTSEVTGTASGLAVTGDAASDDLSLLVVTLTKSFGGPAAAGSTVTLNFTLQNLGAEAVAGLSFTDDLSAVLPGLVATGLPLAGVCGPDSQISGDSNLVFRNGGLGADSTCSFDITLEVPEEAAPGDYPNITGVVTADGRQVGNAASDILSVQPPPVFGKNFSPAVIVRGQISTLTFTIDNSASALEATGLAFTDPLPPGVVIATPSGASMTCAGGTLTAVDGGSSIGYSGGSLAAGSGCTVAVDVRGMAAGTYVNVSDALTSSLGDSGTATATLTVEPPEDQLFDDRFEAGE